jgi:hypothetical protein
MMISMVPSDILISPSEGHEAVGVRFTQLESQFEIQRLRTSASSAKEAVTLLFGSLSQFAEPGIHFGLDFLLGVAIALLQQALEFGAPTFYDAQIIIGEFTPLGLSFALQFFPFSFDLIPIHDNSPST